MTAKFLLRLSESDRFNLKKVSATTNKSVNSLIVDAISRCYQDRNVYKIKKQKLEIELQKVNDIISELELKENQFLKNLTKEQKIGLQQVRTAHKNGLISQPQVFEMFKQKVSAEIQEDLFIQLMEKENER